MKFIRTAFAAALIAAGASSAFAAPISATNDGRPAGGITIGNSSDGAGFELQTLLPQISDVQADQTNFGLFSISGSSSPLDPFENFNAQLRFEVTSFSNTHVFGMWFDGDGDGSTIADRIFAPLFGGTATAPSLTSVLFNLANQSITVGATTYNGFGNSGFGFYLQPTGTPNPTWYSVDSLNPNNETMFLAYNRPDINRWFFAFEDTARNAACQQGGGLGGDCDHNDIIVSIESIQGGRIPEPGSLALLGLGLAGLAAASRRKQKQA